MKKIEFKNGFKIEIDEAVLDNMELVDALAEMHDDENPLEVSRVITLILGKEKKKALYDHVRTKDGRVPVAEVSSMIREIFEALGDTGKNS